MSNELSPKMAAFYDDLLKPLDPNRPARRRSLPPKSHVLFQPDPSVPQAAGEPVAETVDAGGLIYKLILPQEFSAQEMPIGMQFRPEPTRFMVTGLEATDSSPLVSQLLVAQDGEITTNRKVNGVTIRQEVNPFERFRRRLQSVRPLPQMPGKEAANVNPQIGGVSRWSKAHIEKVIWNATVNHDLEAVLALRERSSDLPLDFFDDLDLNPNNGTDLQRRIAWLNLLATCPKCGTSLTCEELLDLGSEDDDSQVRCAAWEAFGAHVEHAEPEMLTRLIERFDLEQDVQVRLALAEVFGRIANMADEEVLLKLLNSLESDSENLEARRAIAYSLRRYWPYAQEDSFKRLLHLYANSEEPSLRFSILESIGIWAGSRFDYLWPEQDRKRDWPVAEALRLSREDRVAYIVVLQGSADEPK